MNAKLIEPHWERYSKKINAYYLGRHESRIFGLESLYTINSELFDLYGRSYEHMNETIMMMDYTDLHIYTEIPGIEDATPVFPPFPVRLLFKKKLIHKLEDVTKKHPEVQQIVMHPFKVHVHFDYVLRCAEDFEMIHNVINEIIDALPNKVRRQKIRRSHDSIVSS